MRLIPWLFMVLTAFTLVGCARLAQMRSHTALETQLNVPDDAERRQALYKSLRDDARLDSTYEVVLYDFTPVWLESPAGSPDSAIVLRSVLFFGSKSVAMDEELYFCAALSSPPVVLRRRVCDLTDQKVLFEEFPSRPADKLPAHYTVATVWSGIVHQ